ncbi:MAG: uracil-DNA glycosylase [Paludibacteraceae bacterium]|nr:uracil-DNA glycosylase [Paludibacteraceae bacterium]
MNVRIEPSWRSLLQQEFDKPYFHALAEAVRTEYQRGVVYPPARLIFNAFDQCPLPSVKVVILGQDPYHEPSQAEGLCFSVSDGVPLPPSLVNIYKEIASEFNTPVPQSGSLLRWARQGVLLLNSTLTVRQHQANSHQGIGWETFTDAVISLLSLHRQNLVFMLWGSYAQRKGQVIDASRHLILKTAHPSPLSAYRGFFGCNHFRMANDYLLSHGITPIEW